MKKMICLIALSLSMGAFAEKKVYKDGSLNLLATDKKFFFQHEVDAYALPSYTHLFYEDMDGVAGQPAWAVGAGVGYRFFPHQYFGVGIDLQWQPYKSVYDFREMTVSEYGLDPSDPKYAEHPYEYRSVVRGKEYTTNHYLEAPVKVIFNTPSWNKVQFRTAVGYSLGANIITQSTLDGETVNSLHYTGLDIQEGEEMQLTLGTEQNPKVNAKNNQLRPHHSLTAEVGIGVKLHERVQLIVDLYGIYALNNTKRDDLPFSGVNEEYGGALATQLITSEVHPSAIGAKAGLAVFIGKTKEELLPNWKKRKLASIEEKSDFLENEDENKKAKDEDNKDENKTENENWNNNGDEDADIIEPDNQDTALKPEAPQQETAQTEEQPAQQSAPAPTTDDEERANWNASDFPLLFHLNSTDITFYINTAEITSDSQKRLKKVMGEIRDHKPKKIIVIGHTCNSGSDASNLRMGQKRADAVKKFLRENGIDSDIQIETRSKGSSEPRYPNDTEEHRGLNRRIEFDLEY